jgi:hypothetical protein
MRRFFFNLIAPGRRVMDPEGEEFSTLVEAMQHGRQVAWELARNRTESATAGVSIVMRDEQGRDVLQIPLMEATEKLQSSRLQKRPR